MELGSHSWVDGLAAELFLNSCFSDTVFVTLFHTAVERVSCGVHKLLCIGQVPISLTLLLWLVADALSGLYRSECWDKLLVGTQSPSLISHMWLLWTKHHEKEGEKRPIFLVNMMVNVHRNHKAY